ncbi:polar amino acid transport system substrate-binding protein [Pseudomonas cuatrocienegasensis]|uniref:Polar amino acid transport system substrate-binding protein n=1 Tax=Pseudomonas cuatrocienegasensis TaxID=543360 RepID=A0ABY1B687_9PSED|nr:MULTISPECIES: transporter substrate-binding domain-containing protein [Pseudomonas]SEQ05622.1 polar amino acid transport system substrate-binding protein [Pseudomonas cuatrocienegasensis]
MTLQAQPLRIVSEAWPPYIYEVDGELRGLDYETTQVVLERLGIQTTWELMPWKRCLLSVQQGKADALLDVFHSTARNTWMVFPEEPLSTVEFVLFYHRENPHRFQKIEDLTGLTVGVSAGYLYANPAFRNSPLFKREPAASHEANFGKLLRQRVDLVINDRRSGRYLLEQLGMSQVIAHHPSVIARTPMYLGLSRSPRHQQLARRFASALRQFKREPAYTALRARYAHPDTSVEMATSNR